MFVHADGTKDTYVFNVRIRPGDGTRHLCQNRVP